MFPVYGGVNPYPHLRSQTPSAQFCYPNWTAFSPPMKEDQASTPHVQEAWAHNCNYPAPMPSHNCCIHSQHPSYYSFRPLYPQVPPPPPYGHCCGGYPAAYPQPYSYVPPPHCVMEVPRCGYEKSGYHCCECPNHTSHVKNANNNVKIEEQEPDVETKKGESLVPAVANGSSYPILWIPPGYMMNKEPSRSVVENEADEKCSSPLIEEPLVKPRIHQTQTGERGTPRAQMPNQNTLTDEHNLLPLDMNNIRQFLGGGAAKKPHDQEKRSGDDKIDDPSKQFSYPMIWWPYDGQGKDHVTGREERENGRTPSEEHPPTCKVANFEHPDKESAKERTAAATGTRASQRSGNVKIIPVKQLDDSAPKSLIKEQESKVKETAKNVGETAKQEPVRSGIGNSPSPTKKSKLPPICLRVDPPKKRNGSCSSRSPSPDDKKCQYSAAESKQEGKIENVHACNQIQVQEAKEHDPIGIDVVVSHGTEEEKGSCTEEHKDGAEGKVVREPDSSKSCGTISEDDRLHAPDPQRVQQTKHEDIVTPARQTMSETEAAVIIQSAYRGYEVRRWEPLKKLRQIANVREEAGKIKRQIEKLESCSLVDNKEKLAIGETIMSLLIQLDSIQGLHTNIRDVRRSVAKELTTLQEKLDCIASRKSIATCPENAITEAAQGQFEESGLDEGALGSFEIVSDTSIPSCLNGSSDANRSVEYQMEGDSAKISEAGTEPQMGAPESRVAPENSSMDSQDPLANVRPFEDSPAQFDMIIHDKDPKENLRVESRLEVVEEHFENEICRMDWECDLGAAKNPHGIEQEAAELPAEIDDQVVGIKTAGGKCRNTETAFAVEKVEDKHVQSELHDEVIKEKEQVSEVEDAGTWSKDQEINLPNDTPELQCDDVVAIEHEQPTPVEICDLDTDVPKPMETENFEQGSELQEHTAEEAHLVVPGIEVEKEVITEGGITSIAESAEGDRQPAKAASESLCNLQTSCGDHITQLPVSEGVMDACNTCSLLTESSVSVPASNNAEQIDEKITQENEMLRSMLEKLLASGKEQQDVISSLTMKVNDLEKKLRKQKKMRTAKRPGLTVSCKKVPSASKRQRLMV